MDWLVKALRVVLYFFLIVLALIGTVLVFDLIRVESIKPTFYERTLAPETEQAEMIMLSNYVPVEPRELGVTYTIIQPEPIVEEPERPEIDAETLELLACVIYQEAGGDCCTDETRRMVGEVVLNRVADSRYPSTVDAVLTQYMQYGMMWSTGIVWPERSGWETERAAVARAYECAEMVLTMDRILPEDVIFQSEYIQGEIVANQDGIYFCR